MSTVRWFGISLFNRSLFISLRGSVQCSSIEFNADKCGSIQLNAVCKTIEYAYVLHSARSTMNPRNSVKLNIQLHTAQYSSMQLNTTQNSSKQLKKQLNAAQYSSMQFKTVQNSFKTAQSSSKTAQYSSMQLYTLQNRSKKMISKTQYSSIQLNAALYASKQIKKLIPCPEHSQDE